MKPQSFEGRALVGGLASGTALLSERAFTFAHGVDPATGDVTDVHSDLKGENVRGRVLLYPFGKGSTTASAWFLETVRLGNAPAAIIVRGTDLSAVVGSVLAKILYGKSIPVLTSLPDGFYRGLSNGVTVTVAPGGRVTVRS